jgi:hypothetical protein
VDSPARSGRTASSRQGRAPRTDILSIAQSIAREVSAKHALDVDAKSRFPRETFDAAREGKLLSASLMVGNDRITAKNASMLLVFKGE